MLGDRFDHHQKGFGEILGHGFTTKLSSAGLFYKHYGVEIISKAIQLDERHPDVYRLFMAVYKSFVEAVDAIDNGVNQYQTDQAPRYINDTHLSSRIGRLNINWFDPDQSPERENQAFQRAMMLAGTEFMDNIYFHARSWLPARSLVMECLAARKDIDSSREILMTGVRIGECRHWLSPDKFESRKPLPSLWRGLTDDELSELAGISGCIFVHMSGFIGGNRTYEGALAMARASLLA